MFTIFKKKPQPMYLIVGLGNPGDKYARNRHNIGFMAIEALKDDHPAFSAFKSKFQGHYSEANINGQKIGILMPQTFMNESGQSVGKAAKFYKIPTERIIVIHDELDLKPGEMRVKQGGGNAGHNGLKSIQAHLGTADFWRVRVGIGHPGDKNQVSNYVLSDFAKAEQEKLPAVIEDAIQQTFDIVRNDPINKNK